MPEKVKLSPEKSILAINNFIKQVFEVDPNKGTIEHLKKSDIHETIIDKLQRDSFEDRIKYCAFHTARYYSSKPVRIYIDSVECQTKAVLFTLYLYMVLLHGNPKDLDKVKSLNPNFEINILNILKTKNTSSEEILEIIKKQIDDDRRKILEIELEGSLEQFEYLPEKELPINLEIIALAIRIYIETSTDEEYRRIIRKLLNDKESARFRESELVTNPCSIFARLKLTDDMANKIKKARKLHEKNKKINEDKETDEELINKLYNMPDEDLKNYLKLNSTIGTKLGVCRKKSRTTESLKEKIDSIMRRIEKIRKDAKIKKSTELDEKKHNDYLRIIKAIQETKLFSYDAFAEQKYKEFNYSSPGEFKNYIILCRKTMQKNYGKELEELDKQLQQVKEIYYHDVICPKITEFLKVTDKDNKKTITEKLSRMSEDELTKYINENPGILYELKIWIKQPGFDGDRKQVEKVIKTIQPLSNDIIDYYLNFQMPLHELKTICTEHMGNSKLYKRLSFFTNEYYKRGKWEPKYPKWEKGITDELFGTPINAMLETAILNFMEKNNIPSNFFVYVFRKLYPPTYESPESIGELHQGQCKK